MIPNPSFNNNIPIFGTSWKLQNSIIMEAVGQVANLSYESNQPENHHNEGCVLGAWVRIDFVQMNLNVLLKWVQLSAGRHRSTAGWYVRAERPGIHPRSNLP